MVERCFELLARLDDDMLGWEHNIEMNLVDEDFNEIIKGTADAVLIDEINGIGILPDWKLGRNPVTLACDNWQVKTYISMAFQKYEVERFRGIIFQPRLGTAGFSEVTYNREDLEGFPIELLAIYARTQDGLQLHAGDKQCKYCEAKPTCPEYARWTGQVSSAVAKIGHMHELSIDGLCQALKQTAQVKDFIKQLTAQVASVENVAREKLIKNEVTPDQIGYCLKTRKGARKCSDAQGIFNLISEVVPMDKFMSVVDISISELETVYGKCAKEKGLFKSQKDAVKDIGEKIMPFIERRSDSYMLEKIGE
jgi:hypothetical protein